MLLQSPGCTSPLKKRKPRNTADRKHHTGQDNLFHKNPLLRRTGVLCSPAHSRVGRCSRHCLRYLRYQETQNDHCTHEKSPDPHSSLLPPQLTSNSCPRPKAASTAPAKPRETPLTELLHNTLLSHAHRAHNCLTFSDFMSACCFPPPRIYAAPAIKSKQTAHAEILPKNKACLHQSQPSAPVP